MSANLIRKQEDQKYSDYTDLNPDTGLHESTYCHSIWYIIHVAVGTKGTTPTMILSFIEGKEDGHLESKFVIHCLAEWTMAQSTHTHKIQPAHPLNLETSSNTVQTTHDRNLRGGFWGGLWKGC